MYAGIRFLIISAIFFSLVCISCQASPTVGPPPAEADLDPFYSKYMDCDGISVISSERVDDRAFYRLRELLDKMLENRPDLRKTLVDAGFKYIIIAQEEQVTDVPEYAKMKPKEFWNRRARGFGGRTTSCGEENLLNLPQDRYADESIFIHELAHGLHSPGLRRCDPSFQGRLEALYEAAMAKGLYKHDYASTNPAEYWAEAVQAFFDCDRENNWNHNHINTREELVEYDPDMAAFVREIFRITDENDWRYVPLAKLPSVEKTPDSLSADGKYPKYVWCRGFSILGTTNVSDAAMLRAEEMVRNLFRYRHDILQELIDADVSLLLYDQKDLPLPEDVRAPFSIGSWVKESGGRAVAEIPAELRIGVDAAGLIHSNGGRASREGALLHDMTLAAYLYTGLRPVDPEYANRRQKQQYEIGLERMDERFDSKVKGLYRNALTEKLWEMPPGDGSRFAYFAQGVAAYFDAGMLSSLRTREKLSECDPDLAAFIGDVFQHPYRYDWRVTPPSNVALMGSTGR